MLSFSFVSQSSCLPRPRLPIFVSNENAASSNVRLSHGRERFLFLASSLLCIPYIGTVRLIGGECWQCYSVSTGSRRSRTSEPPSWDCDSSRTPSPPGRSAPSTGQPCAPSRPRCDRTVLVQAEINPPSSFLFLCHSLFWHAHFFLLEKALSINGLTTDLFHTYSVHFALVVPHVYVIVQQSIVDGDASLGVDHEHARQ